MQSMRQTTLLSAKPEAVQIDFIGGRTTTPRKGQNLLALRDLKKQPRAGTPYVYLQEIDRPLEISPERESDTNDNHRFALAFKKDHL